MIHECGKASRRPGLAAWSTIEPIEYAIPCTTIVTSTPLRDQMPDGVVDGQPIGDVAAGAVDVDRDRLAAVVGQFAQSLDDGPRGVFLDITDEVDVAQAIGLLFSDNLLDRVDQLVEQPFVDSLTHPCPRARLVPMLSGSGDASSQRALAVVSSALSPRGHAEVPRRVVGFGETDDL